MKVFSHYGKEGVEGRLVLTGMVTSNQVLGAISNKWESPGLFDAPHMNRLGHWCVTHYRKFAEAPGRQIQNYYARWSQTGGRDKQEVKSLDSFLGSLSDEYKRAKRVQSDYVISVAADLFNRIKAREKIKAVEALLERGDVDKAIVELEKPAKLEMAEEDLTFALEDQAALRTAFEKKVDVLVKYPGAAGDFFKNRLRRGGFVAFVGPDKSGKSFWLLDIAWRAMEQGRKVAYFEVGDLSREDVYLRLAARSTGKPIDTEPYQYPVSVDPPQDGRIMVTWDSRKEEKELSVGRVLKSFESRVAKFGEKSLALSVSPADSLSVNGIVQKLNRLRATQSWAPDVVVIDYADILAPINGTAETRDQINKTWKAMRALSMSHSCLVVTASQSDADAYSRELMSMANFSEDKRKNAHVTAMIGINRDDDEREDGRFRLNFPVAREGSSSSKRVLFTAGSLAISNPCILSMM